MLCYTTLFVIIDDFIEKAPSKRLALLICKTGCQGNCISPVLMFPWWVFHWNNAFILLPPLLTCLHVTGSVAYLMEGKGEGLGHVHGLRTLLFIFLDSLPVCMAWVFFYFHVSRTQNFLSSGQQSHSDAIMVGDECMLKWSSLPWVNISFAERFLILKLEGVVEVCIIWGVISKWGFTIIKLISGFRSLSHSINTKMSPLP